ncbi:hypothetical protein DFH27DRAFT_543332 [Peziza echinospora]|nr:hypothetical protein DFH27DRAFT_543332 [Peziza echinospora]
MCCVVFGKGIISTFLPFFLFIYFFFIIGNSSCCVYMHMCVSCLCNIYFAASAFSFIIIMRAMSVYYYTCTRITITNFSWLLYMKIFLSA